MANGQNASQALRSAQVLIRKATDARVRAARRSVPDCITAQRERASADKWEDQADEKFAFVLRILESIGG